MAYKKALYNIFIQVGVNPVTAQKTHHGGAAGGGGENEETVTWE